MKDVTATDDALITGSNNMINEEQLTEFFSVLESLSGIISEECSAAVMPFLCQYVYPPCDGNGNTQFITQTQCINIRDEVCEREWRLAMTTEQGSLLPVCEIFGTDNESTSDVIDNDAEPLRCHYQFKEFCGLCLPLCGTFSQYSVEVRFAERAVIILAAVLALIGGIVVFTAALIRRSEM